MDPVGHVKRDTGAVRVITDAYHIAHYAIQATRVSRVWMDTGETRAPLVTLTVRTRVIKTQATARALVDITITSRTKVSAQHVTITVTTIHVIPILECVIRVAWMGTGEIIAIKRATTVVIILAYKTMDIARNVQINLCMDFYATNNVL